MSYSSGKNPSTSTFNNIQQTQNEQTFRWAFCPPNLTKKIIKQKKHRFFKNTDKEVIFSPCSFYPRSQKKNGNNPKTPTYQDTQRHVLWLVLCNKKPPSKAWNFWGSWYKITNPNKKTFKNVFFQEPHTQKDQSQQKAGHKKGDRLTTTPKALPPC